MKPSTCPAIIYIPGFSWKVHRKRGTLDQSQDFGMFLMSCRPFSHQASTIARMPSRTAEKDAENGIIVAYTLVSLGSNVGIAQGCFNFQA